MTVFAHHVRRAAWAVAAVGLATTGLTAGGPAGTAFAADGIAHFTTPTRNIDCVMDAGNGGVPYAHCVVQHQAWKRAPVRPADCDQDFYPYELLVANTGRAVAGGCRSDAGPVCPNDRHRCVVLAYGQSRRVGTITCVSAAEGVTCRQVGDARHGFRISRGGYVLY